MPAAAYVARRSRDGEVKKQSSNGKRYLRKDYSMKPTHAKRIFTALILTLILRLLILGTAYLLAFAGVATAALMLVVFGDFVITPFLLVLLYGTKPFLNKGLGRYFVLVNLLYYLVFAHESIFNFIATFRPDEDFYPMLFKLTVSNLILGFGFLMVK
ncbi:MAG: hypothetical protein IJR59_02805, partial [Firmicutes bacterium]|nr:hypothetical protein [Bacillota bacterium]